MKMSYCSGISEANKEKKKQRKFYKNTLIRFIMQFRPQYDKKKIIDLSNRKLKCICKEIAQDF